MDKQVAFSSELLKEIDSGSKAIIDAHIEKLDQASNDIKFLEQRLKSSSIPFSFFYALFNEKENMDYKEHYIVWDNNKKKLLYEVYSAKDEIEEYYTDSQELCEREIENTPELEVSKLLCETKVCLRLKIFNYLPDFYKKIVKNLKLEKNKDCIFDRSSDYNDFLSREINYNKR